LSSKSKESVKDDTLNEEPKKFLEVNIPLRKSLDSPSAPALVGRDDVISSSRNAKLKALGSDILNKSKDRSSGEAKIPGLNLYLNIQEQYDADVPQKDSFE